jgi:hypothetical protein
MNELAEMEVMMVRDVLLVFLTGLIEIWAAIPLGIGLKVPLALTIAVTAFAGILASFIVFWAGDRLQTLIGQRFFRQNETTENDQSKQDRRWIVRIWKGYGVIGLGLFAPLLTGAPLGVVIGLVFGADRKRLLFWISMGVIGWSILLGVLTNAGWQFAISEDHA